MKTTPMASLPFCLILIAGGGDARAAQGRQGLAPIAAQVQQQRLQREMSRLP
jgi:hypothetical protein